MIQKRELQKIIDSYGLKTSNYKIFHSIKLPSEMMDYDYADGKRYPTTYIHRLEVRDAITEMDIITFEFSSDVCADMICNLYKVWSTNCEILSENECLVKLPNAPTKDYMISFWKMIDREIKRIRDTYIDIIIREDGNIEPITVLHLWGNEEILAFVHLHDVPVIQDMFVVPSTDRD